MAKFPFRGLIAPVLTPFKENLSLNLDAIPNYARYLADSKLKGVLVNGTTGEGMSMTIQERKSVLEEWGKAVKTTNQHLMVQVGGVPLPHVLELAKHAETVGVNSILCLPELYTKPSTSSDLIRYLKIVGSAAPNTPLFYYHIPRNTQVNIHMGKFLNDSVDQIPTFQGIKFTSSVLDEGVEALKAKQGKYVVFLGSNELMAGAFSLGFNSGIVSSVNMLPQFAIKILKSVEQSDVQKAKEVQDTLTKICSILLKYGAWIPSMKVVMNLFTPVNVGKARNPMVNPTQEQIENMKNELKNISFKI